MSTRRKPRHGTPRLLTPDVEDRLVKAVLLGVPADLAAQAGGVSRSVFFLWLKQGSEEVTRREDPDDPQVDPTQQPYVDLYQKCLQARATAAIRNMGHVQKVAAGGFVTEKSTEELPDGTIRTVEKTASPDWRAAAWYLERQHRGHFGKEAVAVEVSGPGGGPIELGEKDAEAIAARVAKNMQLAAAAAAVAALPAGDEPIDAEIVDEDDSSGHESDSSG